MKIFLTTLKTKRYHSQHKKKTDDGACHQQITRLPSGERTVKPLMVICNVSSVC